MGTLLYPPPKTDKTVQFHPAALMKVHTHYAALTAVWGLTFTNSPSNYFHNSFMCMLWSWENDSWHTEEGSCCFFITWPCNKRQIYLELQGYAAQRQTVWFLRFLLKVDLHWSALLELPVSNNINVVLQWKQYFFVIFLLFIYLFFYTDENPHNSILD